MTILIAIGLHRPATPEEIREICGEDIAAHYHIVNHNAYALTEHRHLGSTSSGTTVYVDERFVSAALHTTVGFIEPRLMLDFSGGRKLIAPGLAAQETIKVLHSPKFMRDSRACGGSIDGNPLHLEPLDVAQMARHDFLVDVALARGTGQRPITAVFAGDPIRAHREGLQFVSEVILETLEEPVDALITTGAGFPLDLTFYQSIKGITAAAFGGSSQAAFGPRGAVTTLAKITWVLGAVFMATSITLAIWATKATSSSVMQNAPTQIQSAPATPAAPAAPAKK